MRHLCSACGNTLGDILFSIPDLPLVDSFCQTRELAVNVPNYTIELRQCLACKTIQVADPPDTSSIYVNYIYESSSSPDLLEHFINYAEFVSSFVGSTNAALLEIGANDGLLISQLLKVGFSDIYAFDPSPQTASISFAGVTAINDFFSLEAASKLGSKRFSVIIANNCFSHIPSLQEVLVACKQLLAPNGILMVEVQSTLDLLQSVVFDYIYHEHFFYHTTTSFDLLARKSGLQLFSVQHVATKGGSYRLLFGHPQAHSVDGSVLYWKYREDIAGIHTPGPWKKMDGYLQNVKQSLHHYISTSDSPLFGYGASATGTVFLRYMDIERHITSIVDDNLKRQHTFSPGSGLPVVPLSPVHDSQKAIVLAWRHAEFITPKLKSKGIPYILPLPFPLVDG